MIYGYKLVKNSDYTEAVDYIILNSPSDNEIKQILTDYSIEGV